MRSEDWTFPRAPRKTVGPFHYTLVMPVYHFYSCKRLFHKTWDIESTVFQCPPLFAPMSHVIWQKRGTLKNSTPNVPHVMKQSFTTIKVVNRHNQGIMKRSNGFPQGPSENRGTLAQCVHSSKSQVRSAPLCQAMFTQKNIALIPKMPLLPGTRG